MKSVVTLDSVGSHGDAVRMNRPLAIRGIFRTKVQVLGESATIRARARAPPICDEKPPFGAIELICDRDSGGSAA